MSLRWAFDDVKNKYSVYRIKECTKKICEPFKEHAIKIINFKKKKKIPLTNKEFQSHTSQENLSYVQRNV